MFGNINSRKMGIYLMCLTIVVACLTACENSPQSAGENSLVGELEMVDAIPSSSSESDVVLDIPEDFLDFQKYIGEDISLFGMEDGLEEYDGGISFLYGHKGTVKVGVGWDGRTITRAVLTFEDKDSFLKEYDEISSRIKESFGEVSFDHNGIKYYSGITDFDFVISRRAGSVAIAWNDEKREIYDEENPNAAEQQPSVTQGAKDPEIGMTAEQILESTWGEPSDINRTTTRYGASEQWVYNTYSGTKYIYLDDGIVTAIQE